MKKTTGSGGTDLVHIKVHGIALFNPDVFGVLAAYLKNRVHLRIPVHRSPGMGGNLVDDEVRANEIPHHVSS